MSLGELQTVLIQGVVDSNYVFYILKVLLASSPSLKRMSVMFSEVTDDLGEKSKIKQNLKQFP